MSSSDSRPPESPIPPDDPNRRLSVVDPDDPSLRHVSVVGDTYTILISGAQTAGRYCLIDMHIPPGGGPGPHRHDFEEMFTLLDGEIQFTFRGENRLVTTGMTVNIPANAPHFFKNVSGRRSRMALHVLTGGRGGLLPGGGKDSRDPNGRAAPTQPGRATGFREESQGVGPQIPHRDSRSLRARINRM